MRKVNCKAANKYLYPVQELDLAQRSAYPQNTHARTLQTLPAITLCANLPGLMAVRAAHSVPTCRVHHQMALHFCLGGQDYPDLWE